MECVAGAVSPACLPLIHLRVCHERNESQPWEEKVPRAMEMSHTGEGGLLGKGLCLLLVTQSGHHVAV